ncbi:hypothetical protein BAUCODRAFT_160056 [Baudoinia panamericana UAMH 10762]|uniref:Fatty acid hydroxylase domain-containing protein n=1 Tax=Baudoinia panamericana (strain UAMH 10762) TaxID=717646 RepID=M2M7N7_BAUPA|nr:uncharacterized protein BAUCODRAFT_160056 [Baudoinia panamericana UAMH 10762]EMC92341.1 hypothetical protein BAUCODRAFT_160056 [Baudoinia panamericana UAMH 10762]
MPSSMDFPVFSFLTFDMAPGSNETATIAAKALLWSIAASFFAIGYSEVLYRGTKYLYQRGKLLRYYPLPQERHLVEAWSSAFFFILPTALFASFHTKDIDRSWSFNPIAIVAYTGLYLVIHDVYFYLIHANFHKNRWLYNFFHDKHHEYSYSMNCYIVGYAEILENMVQVGVPWLVWTYIAGGNWWNWLLPLSLIVFTTLVGHSGYRMSTIVAAFHPLVIPFTLISGKYMLTPGDHQVHHSHRRYNFGLFWRFMDQWHGTYRRCNVKAYDVVFWTEWARQKEENAEQAKKWLNKHNVEFEEVAWGF